MGFLSFHEKYYSKKLEVLENKVLTKKDIYEAKQLLKFLDDLEDEGYKNLNNYMEKKFACLKRLRSIISKAGSSPFTINKKLPKVPYGEKEFELNDFLNKILNFFIKGKNCNPGSHFLENIYKYSEWIGYEPETAYIFLLRDALLPYIYFKSKNLKNIYPWLIGRNFLKDITKIKNFDDDIRLPIYEALESGHAEPEEFFPLVEHKIISVINRQPRLKKILTDLLDTIKEEKIIVVESGCMGTVPLLLKSLSKKVNFKMYTTVPYLYNTYNNNIFCKKYEDLRNFETLYSQDCLIKYSSYKDKKFYVKITSEETIKIRAFQEIRFFSNNEIV